MIEQIALFNPGTVSSLPYLGVDEQKNVSVYVSVPLVNGHILMIFPSLSFRVNISFG